MRVIRDDNIQNITQRIEPSTAERTLWYCVNFGVHPTDYRHRLGILRVMIRQVIFDEFYGREE